MHFKLKVNCTAPIPKLKLKSKNKTFGKSIPKSKSDFGKILKLKLKLNFYTNYTARHVDTFVLAL